MHTTQRTQKQLPHRRRKLAPAGAPAERCSKSDRSESNPACHTDTLESNGPTAAALHLLNHSSRARRKASRREGPDAFVVDVLRPVELAVCFAEPDRVTGLLVLIE